MEKVINECCNTYCYCFAHGVCDFVAKERNCPRIREYIYNMEEREDDGEEQYI